MNTNPTSARKAQLAADRESLARDLADEPAESLQVLSLLNSASPPGGDDDIPMPGDVRDLLAGAYGRRTAETLPVPAIATAPGLAARHLSWWRMPAAWGGLAAAAAVVAFMLFLNPRPEDDTVRGGGTTVTTPPVGAVAWFWLGKDSDPARAEVARIAPGLVTIASSAVVPAGPLVYVVDADFGVTARREKSAPESFPADGVPGTPEWPSALVKAVQAARSTMEKPGTTK